MVLLLAAALSLASCLIWFSRKHYKKPSTRNGCFFISNWHIFSISCFLLKYIGINVSHLNLIYLNLSAKFIFTLSLNSILFNVCASLSRLLFVVSYATISGWRVDITHGNNQRTSCAIVEYIYLCGWFFFSFDVRYLLFVCCICRDDRKSRNDCNDHTSMPATAAATTTLLPNTCFLFSIFRSFFSLNRLLELVLWLYTQTNVKLIYILYFNQQQQHQHQQHK